MIETELKKQMFIAFKKVADQIAASDKKMGFYAYRKIAHLSESSKLQAFITVGEDLEFMENQIKA